MNVVHAHLPWAGCSRYGAPVVGLAMLASATTAARCDPGPVIACPSSSMEGPELISSLCNLGIVMKEGGLGVLLDKACGEILRRHPQERGSRLVVSPDVYAVIAEARAREVERGFPLMVLGLELDKSAEVLPTMFRLAE